MKITIALDTDTDGEDAATRMLNSGAIVAVMHSFAEELRTAYKHGGDETAGKWRERLYYLASNYGVVIE